MKTETTFGAVVYKAKAGPDQRDPLDCNPGELYLVPAREAQTVTEATSSNYWGNRWGMPDFPSSVFKVRLDLGEYSGKDGMSLLSNRGSVVWMPYSPLFPDSPARYNPVVRLTDWDVKRLAVGVSEGGRLPYASRRAYRKAFPAPAKRRKAVVS